MALRSASLAKASVWLGVLALARCAVAQTADSFEAAPPLPKVLSESQVLDIFRHRGFDLLLAEASVKSAEGDLIIASGVANPGLSGTLGKNFDCGTGQDCSALSYSVGISDNNAISTFVTGKYGLRKDVANAALAAARRSRDDAQRLLESQVKQAYIAVLQAEALRQNAIETRDSNLSTRKLNERRFELGAINEGDLAKIQVAALEAEQALAQVEQNLRTAKVGLAFLLGFRALVPDFQVNNSELDFKLPPALATATRESLLKDALSRRPDLLALVQQEKRAEAALSLAHREIVPDFALSLLYSANGSGDTNISPPNLSIGLSFNLPIFYWQRGEIVKAEADLTSQQILRAKAEASVVADIESAWAGFIATRQQVERMESALLDRAKQARDIAKVQYEKGAASLLDLLDAQRTYTATRAEYAQDLANYWTAVALLEQAMAGELRK